MRKLKLQVQTTVDGYMGGPSGEIDWTTAPWSDDLSASAAASMYPTGYVSRTVGNPTVAGITVGEIVRSTTALAVNAALKSISAVNALPIAVP